jgi:apolipoprotein N-acyltransferase
MSFSGARILSYNRKVEFLINAGLLALAVVFFALPQPNPLSLKGFPFFAYIAFVPLFLLVRRVSFRASFLWGAFYGLFCYCLFSYWLGFFHPLAMYVIGALYFFWLLLVVPLLKLADLLFPKRGFIVQWMLWVGYEYLKTLGFNGYSYGIIGYSQWSWPVIIQIASIFGVWGVSALVVFPSAWIAGGLKAGCTGRLNGWASGFRLFMHEHAVSACLWCVAFFATVVFCVVCPPGRTAIPGWAASTHTGGISIR